MADNVTYSLAADDIGGVHYQRVKVTFGVDGASTDVSSSAPLPVINGSVFADDAAFTLTSSEVSVAGAIRDDSLSALTAVEGDAVPLRVGSTGALHVTGAGGGTQYNVDDAAGGTDTGTLGLAVRDDSLTTLTPIDGDYVPLRVGSTGALHVTGGGGGTEYTEDVAAPNPIVGTATMMERDDALSTVTPVEGDWLSLRGTAEGALWVQEAVAGSAVDATNSTTTPLTGDAAYTGTGVDLLGYAAVCCTIYADVDSATDGMTFQFSTDNTNWDDVYVFTMDVSASDTRRFQFPVCARYFRQVYTNGSGAQSAFRVQTVLHTNNQLTSIHRLQEDMSPDRSAQVVKSVLYAQAAGTGNFTAIDATAGGNLKVSLSEVSDGLDIGAGNAGSETIRVSVSTDDVNLSAIKTSVEILDNAISGSEMQVDVVAPLPAGTNAIGKLAANSGVDIGDVDVLSLPALPAGTNNIGDVDIASALPAGTNAIGKLAANSGVDIGDVDVTSISAGTNLVGDVGLSGARTSGGTTLYKNIDVDESEDAVKATAGQVYWIHAINLKATPLYLKFYNATVATVVVGTTTPDLTFPVPSQGDTNGAGFTLSIPNGIAFGTAITIAATTGVADADSGAPGANELIVNLGYA